MLAALAVVSDVLTITTRGLRLSGSFLAIVLAMAFLGPGPAVAIGLLTIAVDSVRARPRRASVIINLATYATYPLIGALLASAGRSITAPTAIRPPTRSSSWACTSSPTC